MPTSSVELRDHLGPGDTAPTRSVVFRCAWPDKKPILVGNFDISKDASEPDMRTEAERLIALFVVNHLPDGTPVPAIIEINPGALRWIPDTDYYRHRGA